MEKVSKRRSTNYPSTKQIDQHGSFGDTIKADQKAKRPTERRKTMKQGKYIEAVRTESAPKNGSSKKLSMKTSDESKCNGKKHGINSPESLQTLHKAKQPSNMSSGKSSNTNKRVSSSQSSSSNKSQNLSSQSVPSTERPSSISKRSAKERSNGNRGNQKQSKDPVNKASVPSGVRSKKEKQPQTTDLSDPMMMLMMMEGGTIGSASESLSQAVTSLTPASSTKGVTLKASTSKSHKEKPHSSKKKQRLDSKAKTEDSGSEEMSDWEDVHDHTVPDEKSQIPDKPVEITLDLPDILKHKKKKKKEFDWKGYLRRQVNRFKKEVAMDMHKVHLLCLLSLGMRQNEELNDLTLTGVVMSMLPSNLAALVSGLEGSSGLERRVESLRLWYKKAFSLEHVKHCSNIRLVLATAMAQSLSKGNIEDARVWALVFICILRTIGLSVRLVLSFQVMSFKALQEEAKNVSSGKKELASSKESPKSNAKNSSSKSNPGKASKEKGPQRKSTSYIDKPSTDDAPARKAKSAKANPSSSEVIKRKSTRNKMEVEDDNVDQDSDMEEERLNKNKAQGKRKAERKSIGGKSKAKGTSDSDSDSDFSPSKKFRKDVNRKILSETSDDREDGNRINRSTIAGHNFWLEVYFPDKKKWLCFDCFKGQFGKPYSLENTATQPLTYVVAYKNDGGVKDVTARYAKLWMSHTRKQRVDPDWWEETLAAYDTTPHCDNVFEDDEIKGQLLVRPMPTSIADFKGHPLYALRRHLLKFEAIYPDSAIPLGYIRQEPVYARECVHTLHSRDNWLKEGRLVRIGEEPYKMVKSRPKWNRPKENPDELDLEVYGEWQTDKYIPPPAVNGKVPKNEYGNLELFQPWMLPLGTVQLKVNGLQRIAKKLNIDVAPAMVGWDHHSGRSHPMFDGVVVCEEYADTLMAAWTEDQEIQALRETERREKRIYGNWKLLIKGLLIKHRLTQKFMKDDINPDDRKEQFLQRVETLKNEQEEKEGTFSDAETAADFQQSWPRRQQEEVRDRRVKDWKRKAEAAQRVLEGGNRQIKEGKLEKLGSAGMGTSKGRGVESCALSQQKDKRSPTRKEKKPRTISNLKGKHKPRFNAQQQKNNMKQRKEMKKESDHGEDSDEDSDEVDGSETGFLKQGRAVASSRPKRRSVGTVKYFEKDDDDSGDDFVDDSDKDCDFDVKKEIVMEKDTKSKTKSASCYFQSEDDASSDENNESIVKEVINKKPQQSPRVDKPSDPTKHWLDESGSSSDDDDFVPVDSGSVDDFLVTESYDIDDESKGNVSCLPSDQKLTHHSQDSLEEKNKSMQGKNMVVDNKETSGQEKAERDVVNTVNQSSSVDDKKTQRKKKQTTDKGKLALDKNSDGSNVDIMTKRVTRTRSKVK